MAMKTRQQRMVDAAKSRDCPSNHTDFKVLDYVEIEPGVLSILTYSYHSQYGEMGSTTARWLAWHNDHNLAGGVLHTDFDK